MSVGWQEELRQRLVDRNTRESAYSGIIEQYRRLAQQTRLLKERNQSLLRAVGSARTAGSGSAGPSGTGGSGEDNPVRNAYIASLESQISSLRDEMAAVYKTQGQNAQRLLAMNETLREKEEVARSGADELRRTKEEVIALHRKVDQHNDLTAEKDERLQTLHDEIQALELELNQVTDRNAVLKQDNASLLSRWLDKMNEETEKMNTANLFYEDMKSRKNNNGDTNSAHKRAPSEESESYSTNTGEVSSRPA
ncbi:hypothetical protein FRB94_009521 [Tulasnella sp. JGI-2019a]|nr:hypothetical protein FRB94_009521 [Tulasnella sp. JGI-2019a]